MDDAITQASTVELVRTAELIDAELDRRVEAKRNKEAERTAWDKFERRYDSDVSQKRGTA